MFLGNIQTSCVSQVGITVTRESEFVTSATQKQTTRQIKGAADPPHIGAGNAESTNRPVLS